MVAIGHKIVLSIVAKLTFSFLKAFREGGSLGRTLVLVLIKLTAGMLNVFSFSA